MTVKLLGNNDLNGSNTTAADYLRMQKFIASVSVTLTEIQVEVDSSWSGHELKVAIYNDNAGEPGTVAGYSNEYTPTATGVVAVPLVASVSVVAGTAYWLAFVANGSILYTSPGGTTVRYKSATYSSSYTFADNPSGLNSTALTSYQIAGYGTAASSGRACQVIVC